MSPVRWVPKDAVLAIHDLLLAEHGGLTGLRDEAALDAALARPRQKQRYEDPTLPELAAAYAFGIARSHPFADGNKRLALSCADVFLRLNGHRLAATEVDAVATFVELAAGDLDEAALTAWIQRHAEPLS